MKPVLLSQFTATSCIGSGLAQTVRSLGAQHSGLAPCTFAGVDIPTYVGEVVGLDEHRLPDAMQSYDCRNNRLAHFALMQDGFDAAVARSAAHWGPRRVGVFVGTSTSGILQTEIAYRRRDPETGGLPEDFHYAETHNSFSVADFARKLLGVTGPAFAISSACASSAKVFGSAQRMIAAGLIDAAVVGGVDTLCLTTLYGFHSLQLTSTQACRPFDVSRDGISIAEAAAFVLLERAPAKPPADSLLLAGVGESSDAYHMSAPHPQGLGAQMAMRAALRAAGLDAAAIDYVNFHGTGTLGNDRAEGEAFNAIFARTTPCSSTKGATGHALGAAGALEAVICALALQNGSMPAGAPTAEVEPAVAAAYLLHNRRGDLRHVLSNSFGFGGTNCSLILSRAA